MTKLGLVPARARCAGFDNGFQVIRSLENTMPASRHHVSLPSWAAPFIIALGLLQTGFAQAEPGVSESSITLGQSTTLSGPLGVLGQEVLKGAKVYFDALNTKGGIHGRSIHLLTKDDVYDAKKTLENVNAFITDDSVFALFGTFGTPNNEALIPVAQKAGLSILTPSPGPPSIRKPSFKGVFNLRA